MALLPLRKRPSAALGSAVVGLTLVGVWVTTRATWVLTHGGSKALDGAFDYPGWAAIHFITALAFVLILPFQLWSRLRTSLPAIHRVAGRVAGVCGLLFSLTGVVLPWEMPARPFSERTFMAAFGLVFGLMLCRAIAAARRGDIATHRLWMLRVTAAALSPLTERMLFPLFALAGIDSMVRFWDLFVTALWSSAAINLVIAEWWIQRTAGVMFRPQSVIRERVAS